MNPSFCEDDCDTDYYYYYYYVGVGVVFSSRLDGDEHTCRSCLVLLLLSSSFSTTCSCIFSRTKPREVFSPISSFHREAWSSVVSRSAKPRVARGKTTFPICFVSYNFIFLFFYSGVSFQKIKETTYILLCHWLSLRTVSKALLRPNNALLCFCIKNFYSCVLVTDYSIKRNHHHHRQNVTPAYRRDTTRSKPAIRAIETKEYLPSIARETERERERETDRQSLKNH